tara:strand:- start:344 stop:616 length:273 start_codon:yes stop_codon:yes gene_type:complete
MDNFDLKKYLTESRLFEEEDIKIELTNEVKDFIDDKFETIEETGMDIDDLDESGYFEEEMIDQIIEEFDEDDDKDGVSEKVEEYIQSKIN